MSCQDTKALLSSVTREQTTHWWAVSIPRLCCHLWHQNKIFPDELSIYQGFVVICDTRTKYSLMSCQDTQALSSSVTREQTTLWWAVNILRLCCNLWHQNKIFPDELSGYQGFVVICDKKTNYSLVSCQYTQAVLSSLTREQITNWWAVSIRRLCGHLWHKYKLLTGELSIYLGFVVICDTRTNYLLVSCQYTQAVLSSLTREQTTTVELWSLELACLEHQGLLELVRRSRQFPYIFNVKIHPRLEQWWLKL